MAKQGVLAKAAVLSIFLFIASPGVVNPALQGLAEKFPSVSFTTILLVATLPTLVMIPISILSGAVAGSRVGYKTLVVFGAILSILGGVLPFFFSQSFTAILASRVVFGIGLGIMSPLGSALVLRLFEGKEANSLMGFGSASIQGGAIVMALVAGALTASSVRLMWLGHLVLALSLLLCLFWLPEPKKIEKVADAKASLPARVYLVCLLNMVAVLCQYPIYLLMSSVVIKNGFGDAASAGIALSLINVGGFCGALVFGKVTTLARRFTLSLALVVVAVGLALVGWSTSFVVLAAGAFIMGAGTGMYFPALMTLLGTIAPPAAVAASIGLAMASQNISGFLSPYFVAAVGTVSGSSSLGLPLVAGAAGALICMVLFMLVKPAQLPAISDTTVSDEV